MPAGQPGSGYHSPLLDLPGAVPATAADAGVAEHYGDPLGEQRSVTGGAGLCDTSHWPLIEVSGPDRLTWLDGLTTRPMAHLAENRTIETLMLTAEGYVDHRLVITEFGGHAWVSPEPGAKDRLLDEFDVLRSGMRVEVRDVSAEWTPLVLVGADADSVLTRLGVAEPPQPFSAVSLAGGGWLWRLPLVGGVLHPMVVPRRLLRRIWRRLNALGVHPAGHGVYTAMRVAGRGARVGFETDDHTLPQEVGWMGVMVDPGKTGYRGHEALARTLAAGPPPRRLVLLRCDAPMERLPPRGADVEWEGRRVGFVGTAVCHFTLGALALALVEREVPDGVVLRAGGADAAVLPPPRDGSRSGP